MSCLEGPPLHNTKPQRIGYRVYIIVCPRSLLRRCILVDVQGALERRLVLSEDRQDIVNLLQCLKERNEVEEFSVVGVVKPRGHGDLQRGKSSKVKTMM